MDTLKQKYLAASEGSSWQRTVPIAVIAATWLISASSAGAVDIQSIQLGSLNNPNINPNPPINGVTYLGQSQSIISFTDANNTNWVLNGGPASTTLYLRRSGTGAANRQVVFGRQIEPGPPNGSTVLPPVPSNTQSVLSQNNIFSGTDNVFANTDSGKGNFSDVERVDFIFNQSLSPATNLGVTVFERGNGHDSFRIAAITALNGSTPTAYGSLLNFDSWGTSGLTGSHNYTVLNTANNANVFGISDATGVVAQDIGGVVIPLTDLVATSNTPVYGYSLFAADVPLNASSSTLVNFQNFSNNTSQASSAGGIDLLSANLGVVRAEPVPFKFSPSLGLLILGATWGAKSLWQRNRIKRFKLS